jgi:8-oxo-dGTP diphosphatase
VHNWLVAAGVPRRPNAVTPRRDVDDDEIRRLYCDEHPSGAEIGKLLGCSADLVYFRLSRRGIERRSPVAQRRGPSCPSPEVRSSRRASDPSSRWQDRACVLYNAGTGTVRGHAEDRSVTAVGAIPPTAIRDVYVIVRKGSDALLMLREGTGYKDGAWGLPSGKVEPGETYAEAAVRELAEETGVHVETSDLDLALMLDRLPADGGHWVGVFFVVEHHGEEPFNAEPAKCREIGWCSPAALPRETVDYVGSALQRAADGERYAVWRDL